MEFIDEVVAQALTRWGITRAHPVLSRAHPYSPGSPETHPARVSTGRHRSPTQTGVTDFCYLGGRKKMSPRAHPVAATLNSEPRARASTPTPLHPTAPNIAQRVSSGK